MHDRNVTYDADQRGLRRRADTCSSDGARDVDRGVPCPPSVVDVFLERDYSQLYSASTRSITKVGLVANELTASLKVLKISFAYFDFHFVATVSELRGL